MHFILTDMYISHIKPDSGSVHGDVSILSANVNGFLGNLNSFGDQPSSEEDPVSCSTASNPSRLPDPRLEGSKKLMGSVSALKELVICKNLIIFIFTILLIASIGQNSMIIHVLYLFAFLTSFSAHWKALI